MVWCDVTHRRVGRVAPVDHQTGAVVVPVELRVQVDRALVGYLTLLLERLVDEDDSNQQREALLSEACDVTHEGAEVKRDDEDQEQAHPHSDPEPEAHVVQTPAPARYRIHQNHSNK